MATIKFNYTIPFGASLRVGYKLQSSSDPYTYLSTYPSYNDSPFSFDGISVGTYQLELTTICNSCSGSKYSDAYVVSNVAAT